MKDTYIERLAASIRQHVAPELLPDDPDADTLFLFYAALGLAKGQNVDRQDVHNTWAAWMASRKPSHESIKPYSELTEGTKREDDPYVSAIHAALAEWEGLTTTALGRWPIL